MRAAVLYEVGTPMAIEDVSLDGPRDDEVLVRIGATGTLPEDASWAVLPDSRTASAEVKHESNEKTVGFAVWSSCKVHRILA